MVSTSSLPDPRPSLLAVSDDFTGCVAFAGECREAGVPAAIQAWDRPLDARWLGAVVADTQSRLASSGEGIGRVHAAVSAAVDAVGARRLRVFKRFDSGLRGHVGSELATVTDTLGVPCIVASAAPALGITVEGGEHLLRGVPVHLTEYGTDPAGSLTSHLPSVIPGRVATLSLEVVRSGSLAAQLAAAADASDVVVVDGETQEDLRSVAMAVAQYGRPVALAGTYGFGAFASLAFAAGPRADAVGSLAVVGSMRAVSMLQALRARAEGAELVVCRAGTEETVAGTVGAALERGTDVVLVASDPAHARTDDWDPIAASRLAETAALACRRVTPSAVILVGGETAARTMDATGTTRSRVVMEPWPTSALLVAEGGDLDGVLVLTKSGAIGGEEWLVEALDLAKRLARNSHLTEIL